MRKASHKPSLVSQPCFASFFEGVIMKPLSGARCPRRRRGCMAVQLVIAAVRDSHTGVSDEDAISVANTMLQEVMEEIPTWTR
jgi:hypothetical protein